MQSHTAQRSVVVARMPDRSHLVDEAAPLSRPAGELYEPLRRFFLRRLRPAESADADDLVQEVFVHLANREGRPGGGIERVESYIFATAANVMRDRLRRRTVRQADLHDSFDEDMHVLLEDRTPERVLMGKQSVARIQAALQDLPPRVRAAFVLHQFEHLHRTEIANRLRISVSSVEKDIAKALRHLTESLRNSL